MDPADLELLTRSLRHATETHTGPALDAALRDLGWADALADDPGDPVAALFTLQGRAHATSSALDQVLALGADCAPGTGGVVLPPVGELAAPASLDRERLTVRGLATAGSDAEGPLLVVARSGGDHVAVLVDVDALDPRPVQGLDPALGLRQVHGEVAAGAPAGPADWSGALAVGQLALGHELVGASRAMLARACDHARDRIQFGVPVASFQAVRHKLAETLVAVEMATALLDAAWREPSPTASALAKAAAGRGARVAARHSQQVLAGIGFTTEADLHLYVRRILVLEQLLGSTGALARAIGDDARRGRLPAAIPL